MPMPDDALLVLVTAPDAETAAQLGRALVEERLAACANILPGLRSIYRWQGAVQDDAEVLMLIKTTAAAQPHLTQRILQLHPYDTPEVVALPIVAGADGYLGWLVTQVDVPAAASRDGT
jgi:periplasmic divalent cation tolerance protein